MEETYLLNVEGVKKKILHGGQGELPKLQDGSKVSCLGCYPKALGEGSGSATLRLDSLLTSQAPGMGKSHLQEIPRKWGAGGAVLGAGSHIAHCLHLALVQLPTSSLCPGAVGAQQPQWVAGNLPFLTCRMSEWCQWGPLGSFQDCPARGYGQISVASARPWCMLWENNLYWVIKGEYKESSRI